MGLIAVDEASVDSRASRDPALRLLNRAFPILGHGNNDDLPCGQYGQKNKPNASFDGKLDVFNKLFVRGGIEAVEALRNLACDNLTSTPTHGGDKLQPYFIPASFS